MLGRLNRLREAKPPRKLVSWSSLAYASRQPAVSPKKYYFVKRFRLAVLCFVGVVWSCPRPQLKLSDTLSVNPQDIISTREKRMGFRTYSSRFVPLQGP